MLLILGASLTDGGKAQLSGLVSVERETLVETIQSPVKEFRPNRDRPAR